jgi:hypothetical protein
MRDADFTRRLRSIQHEIDRMAQFHRSSRACNCSCPTPLHTFLPPAFAPPAPPPAKFSKPPQDSKENQSPPSSSREHCLESIDHDIQALKMRIRSVR